MNANQALKDAENALRDFISAILTAAIGSEWIDKCGVSSDRIDKWKGRKQDEARRQEAGVVDERLIYYADFYDLRTILKKHWQHFAVALGDWKTIEVWLSELERLRDPDAHRRELLPHQINLALGISGEIRGRIIRFRSKQETPEDYFPRIESARDSLGNIWTPDSPALTVITRDVLRPGDQIDYVLTATDPLGGALKFGFQTGIRAVINWSDQSVFSVHVLPEHIGVHFRITIYIASMREHHASSDYDQFVEFTYAVLPPRN